MSASSGEPGPAPDQPSRASKILRRTKVGGSLAAVVAAVLYASSFTFGEELTLALGLLITGWGAVEVRRMGLFPTAASAPAAMAGSLVAAGLMHSRGVDATGLLVAAQRDSRSRPSSPWRPCEGASGLPQRFPRS